MPALALVAVSAVEEAERDVAAGRVVAHDDVLKLLDSWSDE